MNLKDGETRNNKMKFRLTTTKRFYTKEEKEEVKELGFEFEVEPTPFEDVEYYLPSYSGVEIEINSLEELMAFSKKWGELILSNDTIEIYNDFRE